MMLPVCECNPNRSSSLGPIRKWRAVLPAAPQVAQKGARAMVKVFTDLQASAGDVRSWYGVGLEPTIGLVGFPAYT